MAFARGRLKVSEDAASVFWQVRLQELVVERDVGLFGLDGECTRVAKRRNFWHARGLHRRYGGPVRDKKLLEGPGMATLCALYLTKWPDRSKRLLDGLVLRLGGALVRKSTTDGRACAGCCWRSST